MALVIFISQNPPGFRPDLGLSLDEAPAIYIFVREEGAGREGAARADAAPAGRAAPAAPQQGHLTGPLAGGQRSAPRAPERVTGRCKQKQHANAHATGRPDQMLSDEFSLSPPPVPGPSSAPDVV